MGGVTAALTSKTGPVLIDPLRAKLSAHETKAALRAVVVEPQTD